MLFSLCVCGCSGLCCLVCVFVCGCSVLCCLVCVFVVVVGCVV